MWYNVIWNNMVERKNSLPREREREKNDRMRKRERVIESKGGTAR